MNDLSPQQKQHLKFQELKLKEAKLKLMDELPHLYGRKFYSWSRLYFESRHQQAFLCAPNQVSKSSTLQRKMIHWATCPTLWPKIWPSHPRPRQFWYFYPSLDVATDEFENKWEVEWLPRGEKKLDPVFGWTAVYEKGLIDYIQFNTGVRLYFKSYGQKVTNVQTATVHFVGCDEELPMEFYDELQFRTSAVDGIFNMVFTATLGQAFWQSVIEGPKLPESLKIQIRLEDCMYYEDGTESPWTEDKIRRTRAKCKSKNEELKRCDGRFVPAEGLKYPSFQPVRHMIAPVTVPQDWVRYAAVDPGSGGHAHPAGMVFIAVRPDMRKGYVFRAWRGDDVDTESSDILKKFRELRGSMKLTNQFYDYQARDFSIVSSRAGESFTKAEKSHTLGEDILNTLFRNDMLFIFEGDPELAKLCSELSLLQNSTPKNKAIDDLVDPTRYCCVGIPWDFSGIAQTNNEIMVDEPQMTPQELELYERSGGNRKKESENWEEDLTDQIEFWNDEYGSH